MQRSAAARRAAVPGASRHLPDSGRADADEHSPRCRRSIWLLVATAPATLVVMELAGGYRRLLGQSPVRLVMTAMLSQVVAISFGAFIVFALKLSSSSRVVIFTYGLLSAVGLIAYRGTIWTYQRRREESGVYAKNVLLVGQPRSVEWMVRHFRRNVPDTRVPAGRVAQRPRRSSAYARTAEGRQAPAISRSSSSGASRTSARCSCTTRCTKSSPSSRRSIATGCGR